VIPSRVVRLDCAGMPLALTLADGRRVTARTAVVACGARYRRPAIPNLEAFEGRGVWYWASPIEARLCRQQQVALVGGGNSAGQAAVFLSAFAAKVSILVRGDGLTATMSRYLIDRIEATANIELLTRTEIVALAGRPERIWSVCAGGAPRRVRRPSCPSATSFYSWAPIPRRTGCRAAASRWTPKASFARDRPMAGHGRRRSNRASWASSRWATSARNPSSGGRGDRRGRGGGGAAARGARRDGDGRAVGSVQSAELVLALLIAVATLVTIARGLGIAYPILLVIGVCWWGSCRACRGSESTRI